MDGSTHPDLRRAMAEVRHENCDYLAMTTS